MRPAGRDPHRTRAMLTSHNSRTIGFLCRYAPIPRIYTRIFHCVSDGQQCIHFLWQRSLSLERFYLSFSPPNSLARTAHVTIRNTSGVFISFVWFLLLIILHEDLHRARGEHHSNGRTVMAPARGGRFLVGGGGTTYLHNILYSTIRVTRLLPLSLILSEIRKYNDTQQL